MEQKIRKVSFQYSDDPYDLIDGFEADYRVSIHVETTSDSVDAWKPYIVSDVTVIDHFNDTIDNVEFNADIIVKDVPMDEDMYICKPDFDNLVYNIVDKIEQGIDYEILDYEII